MKKYTRVFQIMFFLIFIQKTLGQPCYPDKIVTAAYATGGESPYLNQVLWLTWGSTNETIYPYGRHNQDLRVGSKSYASIHLGGDAYLCVEAEIIKITGSPVKSYKSGMYSGDSFDKLYNIGGTDTSNQLVAGIINKNVQALSTLTIKAKASVYGRPIRISGLVVADAESLASNEYITATAKGAWSIVDVRKNLSAGAYYMAKRNEGNGEQKIVFQQGNNSKTGAVTFLEFDNGAYDTEENEFAVEFSASLKGGGYTALALGLLTPNADLGDAPESYGTPIHLLHNLEITSDNIQVTPNSSTNVNTLSYTAGKLVPFQGRYLGTTAPDADNGPMYSIDAKGDDITGSAGPFEEDAWPEELRRISYLPHYVIGNELQADIAYNNGKVGDKISGWIDFDVNGTFDDSERQTAVIQTAGFGVVTLKWIIPYSRVLKNTYVRLRYFDSKEDATKSDHTVNYGEVEDHRMYILVPQITNPMLPNKAK
ncbi:MAG TPA: CshA/CshB family fibrillar adhesin-related protein [Erysipelothrix sp.]